MTLMLTAPYTLDFPYCRPQLTKMLSAMRTVQVAGLRPQSLRTRLVVRLKSTYGISGEGYVVPPEAKKQFFEKGYCVLPKFLTEQELKVSVRLNPVPSSSIIATAWLFARICVVHVQLAEQELLLRMAGLGRSGILA